jgi:hypothetical protein
MKLWHASQMRLSVVALLVIAPAACAFAGDAEVQTTEAERAEQMVKEMDAKKVEFGMSPYNGTSSQCPAGSWTLRWDRRAGPP